MVTTEDREVSVTKALRPHGQIGAVEDVLTFLFHDSDDDPVLQHSANWLNNGQLSVAISPNGEHCALARGRRLVISQVSSASGTSSPSQPRPVEVELDCAAGERVSEVAWMASAGTSVKEPFRDHGLLVGTSQGRVKIFSKKGRQLHSQRFHSSAVSTARRRPCISNHKPQALEDPIPL
eukprot:6561944-Pyramimonas_sp.AAC.1